MVFLQNGLDRILPALHMPDRRKLRGDCLARGELPPGFVLLSIDGLELSVCVTLIEVAANLLISKVSHPPPQGIAQDVPLIGDGFPLEAAILRE